MLKILSLVATLSLSVTPALAAPEADPGRLRADVEKLVSFGTRHTLSSPDDPVRGIGAARKWGAEELDRIGAACGDCIKVARIGRTWIVCTFPCETASCEWTISKPLRV